MLQLLSQYSRNRIAWILLGLSALCFELVALFFQHVLNLNPCVLCIYQRCVFFGILIAALIVIINPKRFILRLIGIALWIYCSMKGFLFAHEQATLQFEPSMFHSCSLNPNFPSWLPLNHWFPSVFESTGNCMDRVWQFLTIEMSQWMMIIFICYFLVALLILLAQMVEPAKSAWKN